MITDKFLFHQKNIMALIRFFNISRNSIVKTVFPHYLLRFIYSLLDGITSFCLWVYLTNG